ncbi:MAG: cytochrome c biogenesis protein CcsA [Alistipes sp.]|nr:cytochrome c biogenesis protein CcsA [Alistipes sp.]
MVLGWNIFPYIASVAIVLSASGAGIALRHKGRSTAATLLSVLAIVVMALFVALLWHTLGRPPLRTMGETRLWYSLFMLVAGAATYHRWHYRWILSFSTLMATVFILINILRPEIHDESLMPALQSAWFIPHVSLYMFSYSLLGCATLLAICGIANRKLELRDVVEKLLYGGIGLFTVGMLTGALWAKDAWGAYWSWDAKEAWAATTWGLFLLAIHLPTRQTRRSNVAYYLIVIAAFLSLQMCWYGVNYLPSAKESVHTYNQQ